MAKNTGGIRFKPFQDEVDDESGPQDRLSAVSPEPHEPLTLVGNGNGGQLTRIRLKAVETERQYFLKLMNVGVFRKLVKAQSIATALIVLCQVIMYAIVTRQPFKFVDYLGIGIWAPLVFFSSACWLTWETIRSPSGCSIGAALGFQIASIIFGIFLMICSTISIIQHGQSIRYGSEVPGRIFCSIMTLSAGVVTFVSIVLSCQFCKLTCCSRTNAHETVVLDVEAVKY